MSREYESQVIEKSKTLKAYAEQASRAEKMPRAIIELAKAHEIAPELLPAVMAHLGEIHIELNKKLKHLSSDQPLLRQKLSEIHQFSHSFIEHELTKYLESNTVGSAVYSSTSGKGASAKIGNVTPWCAELLSALNGKCINLSENNENYTVLEGVSEEQVNTAVKLFYLDKLKGLTLAQLIEAANNKASLDTIGVRNHLVDSILVTEVFKEITDAFEDVATFGNVNTMVCVVGQTCSEIDPSRNDKNNDADNMLANYANIASIILMLQKFSFEVTQMQLSIQAIEALIQEKTTTLKHSETSADDDTADQPRERRRDKVAAMPGKALKGIATVAKVAYQRESMSGRTQRQIDFLENILKEYKTELVLVRLGAKEDASTASALDKKSADRYTATFSDAFNLDNGEKLKDRLEAKGAGPSKRPSHT